MSKDKLIDRAINALVRQEDSLASMLAETRQVLSQLQSLDVTVSYAFRCGECGLGFKTEPRLQDHLEHVHEKVVT